MKHKRLFAYITMVFMALAVMPVEMTCAADKTIIWDDSINNVYASDHLEINWYGNPGNDANYAAGKRWAVNYGGTGALRDAEDGSLAVIRGYAENGKPITGEAQLVKRINSEPISKGSVIEITYSFATPEKAPERTGTDIWLVFYAPDASGQNVKWSPLSLQVNGAGITPVWAITQFYPNGSMRVVGKSFDRDPNNIRFDWGKDYTVKMTLKPMDGDKYYRFVAEVWENGVKKGIGIINEWTGIAGEANLIKGFTSAFINLVTTTAIPEGYEPEDLLYLKGIKIEAQQPDTVLGTTYFPADGALDVAIDTECYAEFENAVENVSAEQVVVDGGARVSGVVMGNENKKVNIEIDGLKANTAYTVTIKDVKRVNAETSFDYSWTFTTGNGVEFSEPYFGVVNTELEENCSDVSIEKFVKTTDDKYLSGEAWGVSSNDDVFTIEDGYLWSNTSGTNSVAKKFKPVSNGETLNVSATVYLSPKTVSEAGDDAYYSALCIEGNGVCRRLLSYYNLVKYWRAVKALEGGTTHSVWNGGDDDTSVITTGTFNQNSLLQKSWFIPNWNSTAFDGELAINLVAEPADDGEHYELVMTVKGVRIDITSKCTITKAEAESIDTIALYAKTSAGITEKFNIYAVKNVKVSKSLGKNFPTVGTNTVRIDYTNLSDEAFDADVLVLESDADTGKIINASIIRKNNVEGESGTMDCEFEIKQENSKITVYVLNSADGMVLLSGAKTFDVKS